MVTPTTAGQHADLVERPVMESAPVEPEGEADEALQDRRRHTDRQHTAGVDPVDVHVVAQQRHDGDGNEPARCVERVLHMRQPAADGIAEPPQTSVALPHGTMTERSAARTVDAVVRAVDVHIPPACDGSIRRRMLAAGMFR